MCTASLTFSNSTFCPHSVFMCFVWISEQTAIISLYNINWLVCVTEIYPSTAQRPGCCVLQYYHLLILHSLNELTFSNRPHDPCLLSQELMLPVLSQPNPLHCPPHRLITSILILPLHLHQGPPQYLFPSDLQVSDVYYARHWLEQIAEGWTWGKLQVLWGPASVCGWQKDCRLWRQQQVVTQSMQCRRTDHPAGHFSLCIVLSRRDADRSNASLLIIPCNSQSVPPFVSFPLRPVALIPC